MLLLRLASMCELGSKRSAPAPEGPEACGGKPGGPQPSKARLRFSTAASSRARSVLVFLFIGLIGCSLFQVSRWRADADEHRLDRYLNDVAVLPAIRLGISRRNLNVGSLSFGFCCIHPEASIPLLNHSWVSLAIRCGSHHQLRDAHR